MRQLRSLLDGARKFKPVLRLLPLCRYYTTANYENIASYTTLSNPVRNFSLCFGTFTEDALLHRSVRRSISSGLRRQIAWIELTQVLIPLQRNGCRR